jgi:hypothetical protein
MKFEEWDLLVAEHEQHGVGPLIQEAMRAALRPIMGRVPNPRLVGRAAEQWDHDLREELLYDFALFLLERGRLHAAFLHASDAAHLNMLLRARARQFVSGRLRGTELSAKVKQACDILEADDRFERFGRERDRRWVLAGQPKTAYAGSESDLRRLAWGLPLPPRGRSFRRNTAAASAVISKHDLTTLLMEACRSARGGLSKSDITLVLRERLNLSEPETISISRRWGDEPPLEDRLAEAGGDFDELEAKMIAADAAALLSVRQLAVLRESHGRGLSREDTARALGLSRATISNELRRAGDLLLDVAVGDLPSARRALDFLAGDEPF